MTPTLLNTAGEPERDARSRHWNAIEAMTFYTAIFWLGGFKVGLIIKLILPHGH